MRRLIVAAIAGLLALSLLPARAQDHSFPTPGNATVGGAVDMFLNPSGNAIPTSAANPFPVTIISGGSGGGSVTQGTSPWVDNITQWASVTLGAATGWGVAPTGNVPGVNANVLASVLPTGAATQATLAAILAAQGGAPAQQTGATVGIVAGSAIIGKAGIDQTTPGTTNNVTVGPVNSSPTNFSAATSGTPSTATTLLAASATHQKVVIKVEGATAVCFSQFGTAVIGAAGTWCLKGASTANAGDGGSYVTPGGMSEPNAISMISTGTSILVTGWWQ
jgi:hypothetical protein